MPWIANNNRDSADYTTSMRTDRWYLCIFFWLLNRVVHQLYVTMIYCGKYEIGPEWWQEMYLNKNGRKRFQIDLARELMNYAIRESWTDMDSAKPDWMRRALVIPCNCNKCFFCIQNLTTGIDHKQKRKTVTTFIQHDCTHTRPWLLQIMLQGENWYQEWEDGWDQKLSNGLSIMQWTYAKAACLMVL